VARAFRRDHEHVDIRTRVDQVEVDVQPVRKGKSGALFHVRPEMVTIQVALALIWR
jgi:hypothetical protein